MLAVWLVSQPEERRQRRRAAFDVRRQAIRFVFCVEVSEVSAKGPVTMRTGIEGVLEAINPRVRKVRANQYWCSRKRNKDGAVHGLADDLLIAKKLAPSAGRQDQRLFDNSAIDVGKKPGQVGVKTLVTKTNSEIEVVADLRPLTLNCNAG